MTFFVAPAPASEPDTIFALSWPRINFVRSRTQTADVLVCYLQHLALKCSVHSSSKKTGIISLIEIQMTINYLRTLFSLSIQNLHFPRSDLIKNRHCPSARLSVSFLFLSPLSTQKPFGTYSTVLPRSSMSLRHNSTLFRSSMLLRLFVPHLSTHFPPHYAIHLTHVSKHIDSPLLCLPFAIREMTLICLL